MDKGTAQLVLGQHTCIFCNRKVETTQDIFTNKLVELGHQPPCFSYMQAATHVPFVQYSNLEIKENPEFREDS